LELGDMRELEKRNCLLEQGNEILRREAACLAKNINPTDPRSRILADCVPWR
jgi:hypothetical protein